MSTDPAILVPPLDAQLVESIKNGQCILFLGAGVHFPPEDTDPKYGGCYPEAQQPPTGKKLARILADASPLATDPDYSPEQRKVIAEDLQRMSLYYEIRMGRSELVRKVREAVSIGKQPSRAVKALAELNFPIICTTNYDTLFDRALVLAGKDPVISAYSNQKTSLTRDYTEAITPPPDRPFVLKIHGELDDPTYSIVITDEDYIQFILRITTGTGDSDPIPRVFRAHMPIWPMLFIGYSLLDYNLRLLFQLLSWKRQAPARLSYSVGPYPDGLIRKKYDPPVNFIAQDVWAFVPVLYRAVTGKDMP